MKGFRFLARRGRLCSVLRVLIAVWVGLGIYRADLSNSVSGASVHTSELSLESHWAVITRWQVISRRWIAALAWVAAAVLVGVWIGLPVPLRGLPGNYWLLLALNIFNFGVVSSTTYRKLSPFFAVLGATMLFLLALWVSSEGWLPTNIVLAAPDWLTLLGTACTGLPTALGSELLSVWRPLREIEAFNWPVGESQEVRS